ncbi:MAG: hypothetical protein O3C21_03640 [Verrucomicrobia bacterium]|nr:hypothetical protein [Verrucomicrobiota bacterium]
MPVSIGLDHEGTSAGCDVAPAWHLPFPMGCGVSDIFFGENVAALGYLTTGYCALADCS